MYSTYNLLKFIHVLAVIVWVGGIITMTILNALIARSGDRAAIAAMARQGQRFGMTVSFPAILVTLATGVAAVMVGSLDFEALWIAWGFIALIVSWLLGVTLMRRTGMKLGQRMATADPGDAEVRTLRRRLAIFNTINLLLLISAVWAMVYKPMA